jgi:hypothetical protein
LIFRLQLFRVLQNIGGGLLEIARLEFFQVGERPVQRTPVLSHETPLMTPTVFYRFCDFLISRQHNAHTHTARYRKMNELEKYCVSTRRYNKLLRRRTQSFSLRSTHALSGNKLKTVVICTQSIKLAAHSAAEIRSAINSFKAPQHLNTFVRGSFPRRWSNLALDQLENPEISAFSAVWEVFYEVERSRGRHGNNSVL